MEQISGPSSLSFTTSLFSRFFSPLSQELRYKIGTDIIFDKNMYEIQSSLSKYFVFLGDFRRFFYFVLKQTVMWNCLYSAKMKMTLENSRSLKPETFESTYNITSLLNYSHLFLVFRVFQTNSCLNSISSRTVSRWSKVFGYFLSSEIFFIIARNVEIFSHFYGSLNLKTFLDSLSLQLKKEHLVLILKLLSRSFCWCKPLKERFR